MLSIGVMQERVGDAVDMHGAGAAQRHAAAELGAGHAEHVAQHPQAAACRRRHRRVRSTPLTLMVVAIAASNSFS